MNIEQLLQRVAMERGPRQSTVYAYQGSFKRLSIVDDSLSEDELESLLLSIDNINSRRAAAMAIRSVLGEEVHAPTPRPKRYDLPDEDTLRFTLLMARYETRGLLMMHGGLLLGEACAATCCQLEEDALVVDRQVIELHATPERPDARYPAPTKDKEGVVILPHFLHERLRALEGNDGPGAVRESLSRAGKRVGITLSPHMLRHFFATESLARGDYGYGAQAIETS